MNCNPVQSRIDLLLALDVMLRQANADVFGNEVVPFELSCRAPAHRGLPGPQLRDGLQLLDGGDSFLEEFDIRVAFSRLITDRLQQDWILLQMFRWPAKEMLQIQSVRIRVS